jgi:transcriptional regulator with XRE-family HTH domain
MDRVQLKVLLARRRLTLREAAERAGLRLTRAYRISSGYVHPREAELIALAKAIGVDPEVLRGTPRDVARR